MLSFTIHCFSKNQIVLTPVSMTSEASSTTNNSRKRKLVDDEVDEVFVLQKKQELTITKTVSFSIPDFVEKIDENDENIRRKAVKTPSFKLGELNFHCYVYPEYHKEEEDYGYVGFFLHNGNEEDVNLSMKILEAPGPVDKTMTLEAVTIEANKSWGWGGYMDHEEYREWARENGDVFKIKAKVTLHLKEGYSGRWTTLR